MTASPTSKRRYHSPLRAAQAEATRRRVEDAALQLFAERGYEATTITEIAAAATVSPETIYGVFGAKRGILDAVAVRVARERFPMARWDEGRQSLADRPREQLALAVDLLGDFYAANPEVIALFGRGSGE